MGKRQKGDALTTKTAQHAPGTDKPCSSNNNNGYASASTQHNTGHKNAGVMSHLITYPPWLVQNSLEEGGSLAAKQT